MRSHSHENITIKMKILCDLHVLLKDTYYRDKTTPVKISDVMQHDVCDICHFKKQFTLSRI